MTPSSSRGGNISFISLFHVALLFMYFSARYVLECILLRLPTICVIHVPDNCDLHAHKFVGRLVDTICLWQRFVLPTLAFFAKWPPLLFFASYYFYSKQWIKSCLRCFSCWSIPAVFWALRKALRRAKIREKDMWIALGRFISFTRVSVGRGHVENYQNHTAQSDFGALSYRVPVIIQAIISTAIFIMLATKASSIFSPRQPHYYHYDYQNSPLHELENYQNHHRCLEHFTYSHQRPNVPSYHPHEAKEVERSSSFPSGREFTAVIPACYDGDTCYTSNLSFNGQPLPDIFSSMKVRLLGIDTPELSRARCELERCLARRAKHEMERIVESGKGYVLNLQNCKPDKYGGRMVCDILTRKGEVASELMLEAGLAVAYEGKKKDISWCQHRKSPKELKKNIDQCLSDICPWRKIRSASDDCQDAFNS